MKQLIAIMIAAVLVVGCVPLCGCQSHKDELAALAKHTWYVQDTSVNAVNVLRFKNDKVELVSSYVDGNGAHECAAIEGEVKFENGKIKLSFSNSSENLEIAYSYKDGEIALDSKTCLTEERVLEKIQGNWTCTSVSYVLGRLISSKYNLVVSGNTLEYEYATKSSVSGYDYFYYGPFKDTFKLQNGTFKTDILNGSQFFVRVQDGDVELYSYKTRYSRGGGLVGQNGYSF